MSASGKPFANGSGSSNTSGATADAGMGSTVPAADSAPPGPQPGVRDLSTDRTYFFGASRCNVAGTKLCDGFENGLDLNTWYPEGPAPTVDSTRAARGTKSLHIRHAGVSYSRVRTSTPFPMPGGDYFGRAFFWFGTLPSPPAMDFAHWSIAAGTGTGVNGEIRVSGLLFDGANHFNAGTDGDTGDWGFTDTDGPAGGSPVPLGTWVCIEWMHQASTDTTRFYWDAVEHPSMETTATKNGGNGKPYVLPQFTDVWIGWDEYHPSSQTFELWVDEVAIDHERIGCVL